jgi:predicted transcriptional regulator
MCYDVHMSTQSETVTIRLSPETKGQLEKLAAQTRRTKSFLAGEAIADYVERELAIVEGIKRGLADMEAGRVTPHDKAMRRLRATIERAQKG